MDQLLVLNSLSYMVEIPSYEERISKLLDSNDSSDEVLDVLSEDSATNMKKASSNQTSKFVQQIDEKVESFESSSKTNGKRKDGGRLDTNLMDSFTSGFMPSPSKIGRQQSDADKSKICDGRSEDRSIIRDKSSNEAAMPSMASVLISTPALKKCMERVENAEISLGQFLQNSSFASVFSGAFQSCKNEFENPVSIFSKFYYRKDGADVYEGFDEAEVIYMTERLVTAQAKYCSETPKPGGEKWTAFRKQQEDDFMQKLMKPNRRTLEVMLAMANNSVICFEKVVREATKFCMKIPGFNDLNMDDKIALIKESRQETQVPSLIRSYHKEFKIASPVPGYNFIVEDVVGLMPEKAEAMWECVKEHSERKIWNDITDEEEALLKAIVFTDADRCPSLKNKDRVTRLHRRLIACLIYHLQNKFKDKVAERQEEIEYYLNACRYFSGSFHSYMKEKLLKVPGHTENQTLNQVLL